MLLRHKWVTYMYIKDKDIFLNARAQVLIGGGLMVIQIAPLLDKYFLLLQLQCQPYTLKDVIATQASMAEGIPIISSCLRT